MATQVFLRDPFHLRELLPGLQQPKIAWTKLFLAENRISTEPYVQFHLQGREYRMLVVDVEDTVEFGPGSSERNPAHVYPTWVYGSRRAQLESCLREKPPMLVVAGLPIFRPPFIDFYVWLGELQHEHPDTVIHMHGGRVFRQLFGTGVRSVDYNPLDDAAYGVVLPNGRAITEDQYQTWARWFRFIGYDWRRVRTMRDRLEFCISAVYWAGEYYTKEIPFSLRDRNVGAKPGEIPTEGRFIDQYKRAAAEDGDKVICDACSLAPHCKLYREGAVCTLDDSPTHELARLFGSRNSDKIIEGLNKLLSMNAERLVEAREREKFSEDGLDEKVTKLMSDLVNQGVKVAKLVNPALSSPKNQINLGFNLPGTHAIQNVPPQQLAAAAIAELERRGFDRSAITMDMVEKLIAGEEPQAIEAKTTDET